ncbi:MAG: bifunctional folylpolyglutamate synthase/dihydrofolate synthase [Chloroflexi bacterium]|nr:bifunctional folylpolyglutamate synthase/dihydrofolate synthase [Chloroflexota bacterium]
MATEREQSGLDTPYQKALDYIYSFIDYERQARPREPARYDLRRVYELLARLGNPHLAARTVHVAGTKGKGSVSAMTASALTAAGYRTGLFTSPHLHFYNERIRVGDKLITDDELVKLVEKVKPEVEGVNAKATYGKLTTFEVTTALGFEFFRSKGADFQVIEVGLGGRLDATNVVQPEVCVITSISLDHMEVLGDTLPKIAAEKAGIIKPNVTVVTSPQVDEVNEVFERVCAANNARLIRVGRDVTYQYVGSQAGRQSLRVKGRLDRYDLTIPLLGQYQLDNAAATVGALELLEEKGFHVTKKSIVDGFASVEWPGRLQVISHRPTLVVDGAHNPYSCGKLREALKEYFKFNRAILIFGTSSDKDVKEMISELVPIFDRVIATHSIHPRAMPTASVVAEFKKHGMDALPTEDISEALPLALSLAGPNDLVCVTGSLFLVAGAIEQARLLGLPEQ